MNAMIIDDEPAVCDSLTQMLHFYCPELQLMNPAHSVGEAIESLTRIQPDLLFLDIEMPDGTGFDLLRQLPHYNQKVVFFTAHEEYAIDAVRVQPLDYLLKPVDPRQLLDVVERARELITREKQELEAPFAPKNFKIVLRKEDAVHVLEAEQILHCRAEGNYTWFFTADGQEILVSKTMKSFEEQLLQTGFFKVHRSHILNLRAVRCFEKRDGGVVRLCNGAEIPVASRKRDSFLKALAAF